MGKQWTAGVWSNRIFCEDDNYDYIHNQADDDNAVAISADKENQSCWLNPFPNEAFAPVSFKYRDEVCFIEDSPLHEKAREYITNSFAVHLNNKATGKARSQGVPKGEPVRLRSHVILHLVHLMTPFCMCMNAVFN